MPTDDWGVENRSDITGIPGDVRVAWGYPCDGEYTMVGDACVFADSTKWLEAIGRGEIPKGVPARALLWQVSRPATTDYREFARDLIADYSRPKNPKTGKSPTHTTYPDLLAAAYGVDQAVKNQTNVRAILPALRKLFYEFGVKSKLRLMPFRWKVALINAIVTESRPWLVETVGGSLMNLIEKSIDQKEKEDDGGDVAIDKAEKQLGDILTNWNYIEEQVDGRWAEAEATTGVSIGDLMRDTQVQQVAMLLASMAVLWSIVDQPDERFARYV